MTCIDLARHFNIGLRDMKSKKILKKARNSYLDNDIDGALIQLTYAYAMGSDIAALGIMNII